MNREFKGIWIPAKIWLHPTLSIQAKVLWAEIDSLNDAEKGGCYASDDHLMQFLGVKLSRLHEVMKELRDAGFLKKVSFDGRCRTVKALYPKEEECNNEPSGKPEPSLPPVESVEPSLPENRNPGFRNSGTLPTNIDTNGEHNTYNTGAIAPVAAAPIVGVLDSPSPKSSNAPTPDAIRLQSEIETAMMQSSLASPTWKPPKSNFLAHQCDILMRDGATYQEILNVVQWAVEHEIWASVLFNAKTNPGTQLRKRFSQLYAAMKGAQVQKKAPVQRFGRTSSEERLDEAMRKFNEGFTDA